MSDIDRSFCLNFRFRKIIQFKIDDEMNYVNPTTAQFVLLLFWAAACHSDKNQTSIESVPTQDPITIQYDSVKARIYGADDYGMKKYVMAFLKKGPNRELDSAKAVSLQIAHLENIRKMADEGKLVLAGPFFGEGELRGIYVFDVESIEDAEKLTRTDPAIVAGSLIMEMREWYGSAALLAINEIHKTLSKRSITQE